ncbi:hypothetical protein ECZU25_58270 [Escherichia coli]|nr:hypothetical protein ECZU17_60710 [Escherichia coli]GHL22905.1 hypothetical protein ECZU24_57460 [Escherichia coli]GHL29014.1 hypothetical protein ECZU25_58270 [Escherichia coli]
MGWFIVFIMVITTTGNFWFTSQLSRSEHRHQAAENTQQAATFIRYMNAINDYLHQNPERRTAGGRLTSAQLGLPGTDTVSHIISQQRVFVWATETPGLMAALRNRVMTLPSSAGWKTAGCWTLPAERFPSHFRQ